MGLTYTPSVAVAAGAGAVAGSPHMLEGAAVAPMPYVVVVLFQE